MRVCLSLFPSPLHILGIYSLKDLVFRLSHDSKRLEIDHAFLMKHFDRSWTQLTAGGRRSYMKPQCVVSVKLYEYENLDSSLHFNSGRITMSQAMI